MLQELTAAGFSVLALQQGPFLQASDFQDDELATIVRDQQFSRGVVETYRVTAEDQAVAGRYSRTARCVGGTMARWGGWAWRYRPDEFRVRSTEGEVEGAKPCRLAVRLRRARAVLCSGRGRLRRGRRLPAQSLRRGAGPAATRFRHTRFAPAPVSSGSWHKCSSSTPIRCRSRSTSSPPGVADSASTEGIAGGTDVPSTRRDRRSRSGSRVLSPRAGSTCGRTLPPSRSRSTQRAGHGASAITTGRGVSRRSSRASWCSPETGVGSPHLLLFSTSKTFPDGLANSSGQVGRNLMVQMNPVVGLLLEEPTLPSAGHAGHIAIDDFHLSDSARGFIRGGGDR